MAGAQRSAGTLRLFVLAGVGFLLAWQLAVGFGAPRRMQVVLGLYGFVFHVIFGKAYALVPAYFDRQLAWPTVPRVHLLVATPGTIALAIGTTGRDGIAAVGAIAWTLGVVCFVGSMAWTIRDNPTGRETATGEANRARRRVDRLANAFVPIVLAYLLVGSYGTVALTTALPPIVDANPVRVSHLLAAGTGGLLVFAVGARLLPRLLVASPSFLIVAITLATGAVAPAMLAAALWSPPWFALGAVGQAIAVFGYAAMIGSLLAETDRRRVGQAGIGLGALAGVLAVLLGLAFALGGAVAVLHVVHFRLMLLGFLGFTILGVLYHLYPPAVADLPGTGDRLAGLALALLAGGLALEAAGAVAGLELGTRLGHGLGIAGAAAVCYLLAGIVHARGLR